MSDSFNSRLAKYVAIQILGGIAVILWLVPLYAMLINGFKTNFEATGTPVLVPPRTLTLSAYAAVWSSLKGPIINSVIVAVASAALSSVLGALGAYFFYVIGDRHPIIGNTGFAIIALGTFIPVESTAIPLIYLESGLGVYNSYLGLILANLIFYVPTAALLMSIFMPVVPKTLIEAARIDEASDWAIFWKVMFPLLVPGFLSTLIFVFIQSWNNFFIPVLLVKSPSLTLVSVGERLFTGGYGTLYNETYAAAVLASIVPLIIFVLLGRYFIRGLAALGGGGKGV